MDTQPTHRPPANHHADHPGFAGASGLAAALGFLVGRDGDSALASDLARLRAEDRVVDIGCGPGVAARHAAAIGAEVIGVDPAAVMLQVARRRKSPVSWRRGSAESIPVDDEWASVAWSLATVHHWADIDRGLGEVRRILQPAGRFVVLERRVDEGATGHASHGWTDAQAESFAVDCRRNGFIDVAQSEHRTERGEILAVVARKPD